MTPSEMKLKSDNPGKVDDLIRNTFSETVRRERRNLLLFSVVADFMAFGGIPPKGATLFGIQFEHLSPRMVYFFFALVITYMLISFWLYAAPEYREAKVAKESDRDSGHILLDPPLWYFLREKIKSDLLYRFWVLFEYILPVVFGVSTAFYLAFKWYQVA